MHVGYRCTLEVGENNTFTIRRDDTLLSGVVVPSDPDSTKVEAVICGPHTHLWNFLSANGTAGEYLVVMTVGDGKAPQIKVSGKGLNAKVTVGGRKVSVKDGNILLE